MAKNKKNSQDKHWFAKIKNSFWFIFIFGGLYFIYENNIFHIKDKLEIFFDPESHETSISGTRVFDINENLVIPEGDDGQMIEHAHYTLSYNEKHEQANWVAYVLESKEVGGQIGRSDNFEADPKVRTGSATTHDYRNSGYDRGHLAPAADFKFNKKAMAECFYMSNISPQKHSFNAGIWKKLEEKTRNWATQKEALYIIVGPILKPRLRKIGKVNRVSIPKYFYKVIADFREGKESMIAFLIPAEKSHEPLESFVVSVDEIEQLTGLDFYLDLEDKLENKLESQKDIKSWF